VQGGFSLREKPLGGSDSVKSRSENAVTWKAPRGPFVGFQPIRHGSGDRAQTGAVRTNSGAPGHFLSRQRVCAVARRKLERYDLFRDGGRDRGIPLARGERGGSCRGDGRGPDERTRGAPREVHARPVPGAGGPKARFHGSSPGGADSASGSANFVVSSDGQPFSPCRIFAFAEYFASVAFSSSTF